MDTEISLPYGSKKKPGDQLHVCDSSLSEVMRSWGEVVTEKKKKFDVDHYCGIRVFTIVNFYEFPIYTFDKIVLQEVITGSLG